jgi:hypothetical protein
LVPVALGIFAIPEIVDLTIRGTRIADVPKERLKGVAEGIRDALRNWFLVMRCGVVGVFVGAIPGLGASVVDWFAYGHAIQTEKGANETFGTGDVRGVLAPEAANNAKEGGALIPTIAFGVPGSASMALLLGAMTIQGLTPGSAMLTKDLAVTYTMIWSLAIANVFGTIMCMMLTNTLAKIAMVRINLLTPLVVVIVFLASFQATRHYGDLWSLLFFSVLGWFMKRFSWPRPPLILGLVLSGIIENYLFISISRYGAAWLGRPIVLIVLALIARWSGAAAGASVEFIDEAGVVPIAWRNTICNMMAEAEAWNGVFPFDEVTAGFYERLGTKDLPYPPVASGPSARFAAEEVFDLAGVEPLVALPSAPGNAHPATEVAADRLGFDRAYIGSCTNGSYEDLLSAAQVVRAARERGRDRAREKFVIFPGSGGVRRQIEEAEPRLGGEPVASVLRSVGGEIRKSWCGPCFGQGEDALDPGMRAITSFNRNWENRMGRGGEGYLASPAVVAASALLGYIAPPSELGLDWDPERFGG